MEKQESLIKRINLDEFKKDRYDNGLRANELMKKYDLKYYQVNLIEIHILSRLKENTPVQDGEVPVMINTEVPETKKLRKYNLSDLTNDILSMWKDGFISEFDLRENKILPVEVIDQYLPEIRKIAFIKPSPLSQYR